MKEKGIILLLTAAVFMSACGNSEPSNTISHAEGISTGSTSASNNEEIAETSIQSVSNIKETTAYKALRIIRTMTRYESRFRSLSPKQRLKERKRSIAPLVDAFFCVPEITGDHSGCKIANWQDDSVLPEPGKIPACLSYRRICAHG